MVSAPMSTKLSPSRIWAAQTITSILDQGLSMDECLMPATGFTDMSGRDRALARAIAGTVLRRLGQIDALLALYLARPLTSKAALMRSILRCASAEILFMRSPAFAIVNEAVSFAASRGKTRPFRHLANAVLRKVATEGTEKIDNIPLEQNLPGWLRESWKQNYGHQAVQNAAHLLIEDQPTDLSVFDDIEHWAEALNGEILGPQTLRITAQLRQTGEVIKWPGFDAGVWQVQDAAASLPVMILQPKAGENIIDLCAAPGGKTAQIAAMGAKVTAVERAPLRLQRLEENMKRLRLETRSVCADAKIWRPETLVDAVLVDAPCTATGVFRRHPDVLALKTEKQVKSLVNQQFALLASAVEMVKPGGRVIYCVCSAQIEEGENIAKRALQELPLTPEKIDKSILPYAVEFVDEHQLRIPPGAWHEKNGLDTFFMAHFSRI